MGNKPGGHAASGKLANLTVKQIARMRFEQRELDVLKPAFKDLAIRSGSKDAITKPTFLKLMANAPGILGDRLFDAFDFKQDGEIDYEEFLFGIACYARGDNEDKVNFVFKLFDLSTDGKISRSEMETLLVSVLFAYQAANLSDDPRRNALLNLLPPGSPMSVPSSHSSSSSSASAGLAAGVGSGASSSTPRLPLSASVGPKTGASAKMLSSSTGLGASHHSHDEELIYKIRALVDHAFEQATEEEKKGQYIQLPTFGKWIEAHPGILLFVDMAFASVAGVSSAPTQDAETVVAAAAAAANTAGGAGFGYSGHVNAHDGSPAAVTGSVGEEGPLGGGSGSQVGGPGAGSSTVGADGLERGASFAGGGGGFGSIPVTLPPASSSKPSKGGSSKGDVVAIPLSAILVPTMWSTNKSKTATDADGAAGASGHHHVGAASGATASSAAPTAAAAGAVGTRTPSFRGGVGTMGGAGAATTGLNGSSTMRLDGSGTGPGSAPPLAFACVSCGFSLMPKFCHCCGRKITVRALSNYLSPNAAIGAQQQQQQQQQQQASMQVRPPTPLPMPAGATPAGATPAATSSQQQLPLISPSPPTTAVPSSSSASASTSTSTSSSSSTFSTLASAPVPRSSITGITLTPPSAATQALPLSGSIAAPSSASSSASLSAGAAPPTVTVSGGAPTAAAALQDASPSMSVLPALSSTSILPSLTGLVVASGGAAAGTVAGPNVSDLANTTARSTSSGSGHGSTFAIVPSAPTGTNLNLPRSQSSFVDPQCDGCRAVFLPALVHFCVMCGHDSSAGPRQPVAAPATTSTTTTTAEPQLSTQRQVQEKPFLTGMQGWLSKLGARFKTLKERWFVLKDNFLYSYHTTDDYTPVHVYYMEGCFVEPVNHERENAKLKYGIEIIFNEEPKVSRFLYTKTMALRDQWVKALRLHANVHSINDFYTLDKEIGVGQFSSVVSATSKLNNKRYAVKVIDKADMDEKGAEALRTEVAVLRLVRHPYIIRLKNVFESRRQIHLVLQFISGGDLFQLIKKRRRFPEDLAQMVMAKILDAVRYLHLRGIVHRDLKPENILVRRVEDVDDDPDVDVNDPYALSVGQPRAGVTNQTANEDAGKGVGTKKSSPKQQQQQQQQEQEQRQQDIENADDLDILITDFGLSKFASEDVPMMMACGTLAYVAPEVLHRKGYSSKVDLWSCGVIMYLMLSGRLPFDGNDPSAVIHKIVSGAYSLEGSAWREVSADAKDLLRKLLTVDPEARLSVFQALDHPWFAHEFGADGVAGSTSSSSSSSASAGVTANALPALSTSSSSSSATSSSSSQAATASTIDPSASGAHNGAGQGLSAPASQATGAEAQAKVPSSTIVSSGVGSGTAGETAFRDGVSGVSAAAAAAMAGSSATTGAVGAPQDARAGPTWGSDVNGAATLSGSVPSSGANLPTRSSQNEVSAAALAASSASSSSSSSNLRYLGSSSARSMEGSSSSMPHGSPPNIASALSLSSGGSSEHEPTASFVYEPTATTTGTAAATGAHHHHHHHHHHRSNPPMELYPATPAYPSTYTGNLGLEGLGRHNHVAVTSTYPIQAPVVPFGVSRPGDDLTSMSSDSLTSQTRLSQHLDSNGSPRPPWRATEG